MIQLRSPGGRHGGTAITRRIIRGSCIGALAALAACEGAGHVLAPRTTVPDTSGTTSFRGFDAGVYPGDAALAAWRFPSSPFVWVGYYLTAPCHHDTSWMGRRGNVSGLGWGTAVLYVGQQDWTNIPTVASLGPASMSTAAGDTNAAAAASRLFSRAALQAMMLAATAGSCSSTLLTSANGSSDARDAVAKTASEGFPDGSTIFLDVEYVSQVSPPLLDYYKAWIAGVLADGRYRPGVYCATHNAGELQSAAAAVYAAAGATGAPAYWIAQSAGFDPGASPAQLGIPNAVAWQGLFDVTERWNGVQIVIDEDVATTPSPSTPAAAR